MSSKTKGFTLIEVLAVVAIIAMFVSGSIALVITVRSKTRNVKRVNSINGVEKAMAMVNGEFGAYTLSCNSTEYCFEGYGCFILEDLALLNCDISTYINTGNLIDPAMTEDVCDGKNTGPCNFGLFKIPDGSSRYAVYYRLEGFGEIGSKNCILTDRGSVCGTNVSWSYCTSINLSDPSGEGEKIEICPIYDSDNNGHVQNSDKNDYF
jgi:prepilin-type N-terminal cleavage/methylation domain-containing protein